MAISVGEVSELMRVAMSYGAAHEKAVKTKKSEDRAKMLEAEVVLLDAVQKMYKKQKVKNVRNP